MQMSSSWACIKAQNMEKRLFNTAVCATPKSSSSSESSPKMKLRKLKITAKGQHKLMTLRRTYSESSNGSDNKTKPSLSSLCAKRVLARHRGGNPSLPIRLAMEYPEYLSLLQSQVRERSLLHCPESCSLTMYQSHWSPR